MTHKSYLTLLAILLLAGPTFAGSAEKREDKAGDDPERAARAFLEWQDENVEMEEAARQKIEKIREAAGGHGTDADLVVRSLGILFPDFRRALRELNNEEPASARELLRPMLRSENPYLASNARFFIARAQMQQADYEGAARHLNALVEQSPPRTQYRAESLFRLGVCQARLLRREKALAVLSRFLRHYPNAPEWQRSRARQLTETLMNYQEGSLQEVSDLMRYSRLRLERAELDETTRRRQERIVKVLDTIIEKAEEQARKQQEQGSAQAGQKTGETKSGSPAAAQGTPEPSSPAAKSQLPGGASDTGESGRVIRGRPGERWGEMPPAERERALSLIKSKFPERYRELVEQYYKNLQEEE